MHRLGQPDALLAAVYDPRLLLLERRADLGRLPLDREDEDDEKVSCHTHG